MVIGQEDSCCYYYYYLICGRWTQGLTRTCKERLYKIRRFLCEIHGSHHLDDKETPLSYGLEAVIIGNVGNVGEGT
jgi:hypothetical protein